VTLERGKALDYDKLLIATGGEPRRPPIPGMDAQHVFFLRNGNDMKQI